MQTPDERMNQKLKERQIQDSALQTVEEQQKQKKSDPRQPPSNMLDSLELLASGMCLFEVLFTSKCEYSEKFKKMRDVLVKKKSDRGDFPP